MRFRVTEREEPNLNITPLIDVVFLLLIFFMVTTTFDREMELNVQLPEAAGEEQEVPGPIELVVDRDGQYYVNEQQVLEPSVESLRRVLAKVAAGRDKPVLVIRADAKATHQSVIQAMDAARRAGLVNVSFAVKSGGEG